MIKYLRKLKGAALCNYDYFRFFFIDLLMRNKSYVFSPRGINSKFYLPYIKTDLIQKLIYLKSNYFEYENLDYVCKIWNGGIIGEKISKCLVLDIGANIGNHTLFFLNECNALKVMSFEPVLETFHVLEKNIKLNHVEERVELINAGVSDKPGKAMISLFDKNNIGGTRICQSSDGKMTLLTIDSLGINNSIGLIKIDVEGQELSVLKGMQDTLCRHKPYIMIEIEDDNFEDANRILNKIGYNNEILDIKPGYKNYLYFL